MKANKQQTLQKRIERTRNSIASFCRTNHSENRMGYGRALSLIDRYTEIENELRENGWWESYCNDFGSDYEHTAYDLFA